MALWRTRQNFNVVSARNKYQKKQDSNKRSNPRQQHVIHIVKNKKEETIHLDNDVSNPP